jgi:hypothetical protein
MVIKFVVGLIVIFLWSCTATIKKPSMEASRNSFTRNQCGLEIDVYDAINNGLSSEEWDHNNQTRKTLLLYADKSSECRTEIVKGLIDAMNKPNVNFVLDERSYHLWSMGSAILGELKAVEALDVLIDHLDLNDGNFSASMVHQPAVHGVEKMGVIAVPKLRLALQYNKNRDIRLAAALCLADIGEPEAMNAMKVALSSQTDKCVRQFIELSLKKPTGNVLRQRLR